jgi:hypothetical protein
VLGGGRGEFPTANGRYLALGTERQSRELERHTFACSNLAETRERLCELVRGLFSPGGRVPSRSDSARQAEHGSQSTVYLAQRVDAQQAI